MLEFEDRVAGIPCIIRVTEYEPAEPAYTRGHPDNWEAGCDAYADYEVLDRRGRPAPWLSAKLTYPEHERLVRRIDELVADEAAY